MATGKFSGGAAQLLVAGPAEIWLGIGGAGSTGGGGGGGAPSFGFSVPLPFGPVVPLPFGPFPSTGGSFGGGGDFGEGKPGDGGGKSPLVPGGGVAPINPGYGNTGTIFGSLPGTSPPPGSNPTLKLKGDEQLVVPAAPAQAAPGALVFLGYSTPGGVWIEYAPRMTPVRTDRAGDVPADMKYGGQEAFVGCELVLMATDVLYSAMQRCRPALASAIPRGVDRPGWRGGLMLAEGAATRLLVFPPFSTLKDQQNVWRPANFPAAVMVGPERFSPVGTPVTRVRCLWHCLSVDAGSGADEIGSDLLYNYDDSGRGTPPLAFMG